VGPSCATDSGQLLADVVAEDPQCRDPPKKGLFELFLHLAVAAQEFLKVLHARGRRFHRDEIPQHLVAMHFRGEVLKVVILGAVADAHVVPGVGRLGVLGVIIDVMHDEDEVHTSCGLDGRLLAVVVVGMHPLTAVVVLLAVVIVDLLPAVVVAVVLATVVVDIFTVVVVEVVLVVVVVD
jgi:hypothetical protein